MDPTGAKPKVLGVAPEDGPAAGGAARVRAPVLVDADLLFLRPAGALPEEPLRFVGQGGVYGLIGH